MPVISREALLTKYKRLASKEQKLYINEYNACHFHVYSSSNNYFEYNANEPEMKVN